MRKFILVSAAALFASAALATQANDFLVKMAPGTQSQIRLQTWLPQGTRVENVGLNQWYRVQVPTTAQFQVQALSQMKGVLVVQPNFKIVALESPSLEKARTEAKQLFAHFSPSDDEFPFPMPGDGDGGGDGGGGFPFPMPGDGNNGGGGVQDNPAIPSQGSGGTGNDPLFSHQWGMNQMNVKQAWGKTTGSPEMVVAVLDTGVDYTHEDLIDNLWRNAGEMGTDAQGHDKATNGIDDDHNGYIDDVAGWDFSANDNKPYDLAKSFQEIIFGGGNPGHGTHCAGNVGARANNGKGIGGVAPGVRIMPVRFISEKGSGTTADALKAIRYAVDNGAKVLSNSWGSEGEDPNEGSDNQALRDAVQYAQDKGVLFIAAAGNGHQGVGYDNDSDSKPGVPASYPHENIISVAAIDEAGNLGAFSNWGRTSVDLAAPGVKVFSTTPSNQYQDTLGSFLGQTITWDGTSMATPHVAGAAALYWSAHPEKNWREVKEALLKSVKQTSQLSGKMVSGGQLDVLQMMIQ